MKICNNSNCQRDDKNKEPYEQYNPYVTRWAAIYGVIHLLAFIFAIYLSFKCYGKFNLGAFIVAFFCPWIYIIWILATRGPSMCFDTTSSNKI